MVEKTADGNVDLAGALRAREEAATVREVVVSSREEGISLSVEQVEAREDAASTREESLHLREEVLVAQEPEKDELFSSLREANEKLMLSSLATQEHSEEADRAKASAEEAAREAEQSARELLRVAEFRERLIGVVGHDLRSPLSAIQMGADLILREDDLNPRNTQLMVRIQNSARRMADIISAVLDFTAAHLGGGLPLKRNPTDLAELCRTIIEELELGHTGPADFKCQFTGDLKGVWDSQRLAQVVSNLAGNALQYAAPGSMISVQGSDDGDEVTLSIHNEGLAIPADVIAFIFEPFRRAAQTRADDGGHLGLGLYISKQIVVAHVGSLEVRSTADEGTTFTMRLPRSPPAEAALVL